MRGGISYIAKRHSKANNTYMQSYDVNEPRKYIVHLDKIYLYGWAMSQYHPYGRFNWLNQEKIDRCDVDSIECNSIEENSSIGYILEVDLEYPDKLHNNYPLAPEKLIIGQNMLPIFCSSIANKYDRAISGVSKLVPNLANKDKYVLHYRNLQLYLSLDMK